MKRIALLAVFLLFTLPYPADAFGSYSQDRLNTTNTEDNITFPVFPYSEMVWSSILIRTNITSAEWVFTGYTGYTGDHWDTTTSNTRYGIAHCGDFIYTSDFGVPKVAKHFLNGTYIEDFTLNASNTQPLGLECNGTHLWVVDFAGFVYRYSVSAGYETRWPTDGIFERSGIAENGTDIFVTRETTGSATIGVYAMGTDGTALDIIDISGIINKSAYIEYYDNFLWIIDRLDSEIYQLNMDGSFVNRMSLGGTKRGITTNGTYFWIMDFNDFEVYIYSVGIFYPENITIDVGNDGIIDYINDTLFNTDETITFNGTAIAAINTYLRNLTLCPGDFTTATCDVPFNISSDAPSILGISNISITGEFIYGIFNVSILDEMTGDPFDISEFDSVIISFFCDNETQNVTITSQGQNVTVLCEPNEVRIVVTELAETIIRYLVPTSDFANLDFYVYNSTEETDVSQDWLFFDVTGIYENGIAQVNKVVLGIGDKVMIQKIIDSESKATFFLVVNEKYCFSVFDSNGQNERNLGCMDADADTEKRISISTVPFSPDQAIPYQDVFVSFSWDNDTAIIQALYNDTLGQTSNVTFIVYNASNPTQVLFWATSDQSVVTFTYNNVDVLTTHLARIIAIHDTYGVIDPMQMIDFGGKYRVAGLGGLGLGMWMGIAGGLIATFVMMAFGKRFAKIGSAIFVFMIIMFMQWGWFQESPQIGWGLITFAAFIVFVNVITLKRRLQ